VLLLALVVGAVTSVGTFGSRAHAEEAQTIAFTVTQPQTVHEAGAVAGNPLSTGAGELTDPGPLMCYAYPSCVFIVINVNYPAGVDYNTKYFTTLTANVSGGGKYTMELFSDPFGNANQVAESDAETATESLSMVTTGADPIQQFGLCMNELDGGPSPFVLSLVGSLFPPTNPYAGLTPNSPFTTSPPPTTPVTLPSPATTFAPAPTATLPPPVTEAPSAPPPVTTPDASLGGSFDNSGGFSAALGPVSGPTLFKPVAATKPPASPNTVELILALVGLPLGILVIIPILIIRRRRGVPI